MSTETEASTVPAGPAASAEDLLAAEARLRAPLDIPPVPHWRPGWPEFDACAPHFAPLRFSRQDDGSLDAPEPEPGDWMPCTATAITTLIWTWHMAAAPRIYEGSRGPCDWLTAADLPEAKPVAIVTVADPEPAERDHAAIWPRPDGSGPDRQESRAEVGAQGGTGAGPDRDFSPPPTPGPRVIWGESWVPKAEIEANLPQEPPRPGQDAEDAGASRSSITGPGHPQADGDAEQFGAPDEPFWEDEILAKRIEAPPETTEMTAIIERPEQEQQ